MSNRIRMTGMATGMDTDQTVKDMMKIEQARLDKLQAEKTVKEWTRDSYRDMNKAITEFQKKYLDVLNKDSFIKSPSTFTTNKATIPTSFDSLLAISNKENIDSKPRIVTIKQKAVSARKESAAGISKHSSSIVSSRDVDKNLLKSGMKFQVVVDGVKRDVVLDEDLSGKTDGEIKDKFQELIDDAVGTYQDGGVTKSKIVVDFAANRFSFDLSDPMKSSKLEFKNSSSSYSENLGLDFEEKNYKQGTNVMADFNGDFSVQEHGGNGVTITVSGAGNAADMVNSINTQLDAVYGGRVKSSMVDGKLTFSTNGTGETVQFSAGTGDDLLTKAGISNNSTIKPLEGKVSFGYDDENQKLKFNINGTAHEVTLTKNYTSNERSDMQNDINAQLAGSGISVNIDTEGKLTFNGDGDVKIEVETVNELENLGLDQSSVSNKLDLNTSIEALASRGLFASGDVPYNESGEIEFKINGQTLVMKAEDTLADLQKTIDNSKAGVKLEYNEYKDKMELVTTEMGTTASIDIEDTKGNLMSVLSFDNTKVYGQDAIINMNNTGDPAQDGVDLYRNSNNFVIDGIEFDVKSADPTKKIEINVETDTEDTLKTIKDFVSDYNALMKGIHTKTSERRYRDYQPLTSEQKKALSDDDVKAWEEKAKSGLLRSDSILTSFAEKMRTAVYNKVDGVSLSDIGITTSKDYKEKGKLVIDETKLKAALSSNENKIAKLFTFNDPDSNTKGIAYQIEDIIKEVSGTTGTKGKLLLKAGMEGDRTQTDNVIYKEIQDYDDRIREMIKSMKVKEEGYYRKFSQLEVSMNKLNQQSSWLSQQLGGM